MKSKIKAKFRAFMAWRVVINWPAVAVNVGLATLLLVALGAIVDGRPDLSLIPGSLFVGLNLARD